MMEENDKSISPAMTRIVSVRAGMPKKGTVDMKARYIWRDGNVSGAARIKKAQTNKKTPRMPI